MERTFVTTATRDDRPPSFPSGTQVVLSPSRQVSDTHTPSEEDHSRLPAVDSFETTMKASRLKMNAQTSRRMLASFAVGVLGASAVPGLASAQDSLPPAAYYLSTSETITYEPLSDRCTSTDSRSFSSTATPLPFDFEFLGTDFSEVWLNEDGYILFERFSNFFGSDPYSTFSDEPPPSTIDPNFWIGGFWNSLGGSNSGFGPFSVRSCIVDETLTGDRKFVIEYDGFTISSSGAGGSAEMQFWLFEKEGTFEVHYGDVAMTGPSFGNGPLGVMGYEGSGEDNDFFANWRPCSETESCTYLDFNDVNETKFRVEKGFDPDIVIEFGDFLRGALPGQSATGTVTVMNRGINPATDVDVDIYLSTDDVLDASDVLIGSATLANAPNGRTDVGVTVDVPAATAVADYFLIAEGDPADTIDEPFEDNNITVAEQRFATAYDVAATDCVVTNAGGVNPGQTAEIDVVIENVGAPYDGALEVNLFISTDNLFDGTDPALVPATVTIPSLEKANVVTARVQADLPATGINPGLYYAICQLDPNALITELNRNNNLVVGNNTFQSGVDFGVAGIEFNKQVPVGTTLDLTTTIESLSVPSQDTVEYRVYASLDDVLDDSSTGDALIGTYSVTFDGEDQLTDEQSITIDTNQVGPGRYYVFVSVDPRNRIREVDENNNVGFSGGLAPEPQFVTAVDFSSGPVSRTSGSGPVELGDTMALEFDVISEGLTFSGFTEFQVFFSPDPLFDFGDFSAASGAAFIAASGAEVDSTRVAFSFEVPASIPPGAYNICVLVDSPNAFLEASEANNATCTTGSMTTVNGADLIVVDALVPDFAFAGGRMQTRLTIENRGEVDAEDFEYVYVLSEDDIVRASDEIIFTSELVSVSAGDTETFIDEVTIPGTFTTTTARFVGVVVDFNNAVPDKNLANNIRVASVCEGGDFQVCTSPGGVVKPRTPLNIVLPAPDFDATIIATATAAAGGEEIAVTRSIANIGNFNAVGVEYCYYLSVNPVLSPDDDFLLPIQGTSSGCADDLDLEVGQDEIGVDRMTVPSGIAGGNYYLGILVNPNGSIREVFRDNNAAVTEQPIPVFEAVIQFITRSFPRATAGVQYEVGVFARGGAEPITWAVADGDLPDGLELGGEDGIISGIPAEEGRFDFTIRANSGTAFAEDEFFIIVTPPTVQLQVVTPLLPSGIANREYDAQLLAVGGAPDYTWEVLNPDNIPEGMTFSETGRLSGIPTAPGSTSLVFRVTDSLGVPSSRELSLRILNPNQTVQIQQVAVPSPIVAVTLPCEEEDEPFAFTAINGTPPYSWSVASETSGVPGLTIEEDGRLCGTPEMAGVFPLQIRVQDLSGLFDTALFIIEVDDGNDLAISTFTIPSAQEDEPYTQRFDAIRGTEPYTWSIVEEVSSLPEGLTMSSDGVLEGSPGDGGNFGFSVRVEDQQGRVDIQPITLIVSPKNFCDREENADEDVCRSSDSGGCTSVRVASGDLDAGSAFLLLLGTLGLMAARRRRRS